MKNLFLKLRFIYLDRMLHYFNRPVKVKILNNYREVFFDCFNYFIDWLVWNPSEHWGNIKDDNNPYIIWLPEQVSMSRDGIFLTTDINRSSLPKIKSGQICLWKTIYNAFGRYRIMAMVPPGGAQYWFSGWLIGKECREEIDIFEMMDSDSKGFAVTLHGLVKEEKKIVFSKHFRLSIDLSTAFHLYEVDWRPDCVCWYLDNVKLCEYKGKYIPSCRMGLIVNNAVARGFNPDLVSTEELYRLFPMPGEVKFVQILHEVSE